MFALFLTLLAALTTANQRHSYGANCLCSTKQLTEVYTNARGSDTLLTAITPRMCNKQGSKTEVSFKDHTVFGGRYNLTLSNLSSRSDCQLQWLHGGRWSTCYKSMIYCYIVLNSDASSNTADFRVRAKCKNGKTLCPVLFKETVDLSKSPVGLLPAAIIPHTTVDLKQRLKEKPSCRLFELKLEGKVYHKLLKKNQDFVYVCAGACNSKDCKCKSLNSHILDSVTFNIDRRHNPLIVDEYVTTDQCECSQKNGRCEVKGKTSKGKTSKGKDKG